MSGRHAFDELTRGLTPERRARVEARKAELREAMPLHELRLAQAMTQKAVGEVLNVNQPAVAKLERRTDMYVSNLRAYIEAMGGPTQYRRRVPAGERGDYELFGGGRGWLTDADSLIALQQREEQPANSGNRQAIALSVQLMPET